MTRRHSARARPEQFGGEEPTAWDGRGTRDVRDSWGDRDSRDGPDGPDGPDGRNAAAARGRAWALFREEPGPEAEEAGPERLYVITGGRGAPSGRTRLDLVTLVVAVGGDRLGPVPQRHGLFPEHAAILRLCRRPLSAAELSAHLRLPFSATAVLVDDLLAAGLVAARSPQRTALPDPDLIREVLRGLERL